MSCPLARHSPEPMASLRLRRRIHISILRDCSSNPIKLKCPVAHVQFTVIASQPCHVKHEWYFGVILGLAEDSSVQRQRVIFFCQLPSIASSVQSKFLRFQDRNHPCFNQIHWFHLPFDRACFNTKIESHFSSIRWASMRPNLFWNSQIGSVSGHFFTQLHLQKGITTLLSSVLISPIKTHQKITNHAFQFKYKEFP